MLCCFSSTPDETALTHSTQRYAETMLELCGLIREVFLSSNLALVFGEGHIELTSINSHVSLHSPFICISGTLGYVI